MRKTSEIKTLKKKKSFIFSDLFYWSLLPSSGWRLDILPCTEAAEEFISEHVRTIKTQDESQ